MAAVVVATGGECEEGEEGEEESHGREGLLLVGVVAVDGGEGDVGDELEGVGVDFVELVVEGVPVGDEAAVGGVLDDVDHGDACYLVDVEVVVEDGVGLLVEEDVGVAEAGGGVPKFVGDAWGVVAGDLFFGEAWGL